MLSSSRETVKSVHQYLLYPSAAVYLIIELFDPTPSQSKMINKDEIKVFKSKSSVQRRGNSLNACSTIGQSCVLNNHQPHDLTDGLLRLAARDGRQHFITFPSCSRAWRFEGDREETFATLANNDVGATKTGYIF